MAMNGKLKYGIKPTPVLGNNLCSYNAILTLKQDDPDGHAAALVELLTAQEVLDAFQEFKMIHIIGFYRISRDQVFVQTNFDGGDIVDYWEIIINANPDLVRRGLAAFRGISRAGSWRHANRRIPGGRPGWCRCRLLLLCLPSVDYQPAVPRRRLAQQGDGPSEITRETSRPRRQGRDCIKPVSQLWRWAGDVLRPSNTTANLLANSSLADFAGINV